MSDRDAPMEETRSHELLAKVRHGARYGNIQLSDVEEVLSNELFSGRDGLLTTTESGVCIHV